MRVQNHAGILNTKWPLQKVLLRLTRDLIASFIQQLTTLQQAVGEMSSRRTVQ